MAGRRVVSLRLFLSLLVASVSVTSVQKQKNLPKTKLEILTRHQHDIFNELRKPRKQGQCYAMPAKLLDARLRLSSLIVVVNALELFTGFYSVL